MIPPQILPVYTVLIAVSVVTLLFYRRWLNKKYGN